MEKVVFAYSGGIDNLICIDWLQKNGYCVITYLAQLGQINYLEPLGEKAVNLGASVAHIADLRHKFINEYVMPAFHAEAVYDDSYLLSSALTRPLIAEELANMAMEEDCLTIATGARGIGNDHIRFENCMRMLNPDINIITPLRELSLQTVRDDADYIKKENIQIDDQYKLNYNIESNLWGVNIHLGSAMSSKWPVPPRDSYIITTPLTETLDKMVNLEIRFNQGIPVALDNKKVELLNLIETLNSIGGRNAIGRVDMIETKISGEKIREIYEAPAATILYAAYRSLCGLLLPKELLQYMQLISLKYAELVYNGMWFSPLRKAFDRFFEEVLPQINGTIKLRIYKGNLIIIERKG